MRVIARRSIIEYIDRHPATRAVLTHWLAITSAAAWASTAEVQAAFSKAKVLNGDRVRFEIAGGDFRLIAAFNFDRGIAFVKFIGTHAEDDRIDALTVRHF